MLRLILTGFVLLVFVLVGALGIHSKNAVVGEIIAASRRGDVAGFAARVDWVPLRAFLKQDLTAQKKSLGAYGEAMGPPLSRIEKVVDYYVQPENIDIAYYYHEELFPQVKEEDFIDSTGYAFPFGFQVTLGFPKDVSVEDVPQVMKDRMKARFVFRLNGLTWKIKEMHVPLFMVPAYVYDTPAVKVYGRPKPR